MINEPAAWCICVTVIMVGVVVIVLIANVPDLIRAWREGKQ